MRLKWWQRRLNMRNQSIWTLSTCMFSLITRFLHLFTFYNRLFWDDPLLHVKMLYGLKKILALKFCIISILVNQGWDNEMLSNLPRPSKWLCSQNFVFKFWGARSVVVKSTSIVQSFSTNELVYIKIRSTSTTEANISKII